MTEEPFFSYSWYSITTELFIDYFYFFIFLQASKTRNDLCEGNALEKVVLSSKNGIKDPQVSFDLFYRYVVIQLYAHTQPFNNFCDLK